MTREEAIRRATAVFNELERKGVQPLDDNGWMNPEDKAAIIEPFADAILAAVQACELGLLAAETVETEGTVGKVLNALDPTQTTSTDVKSGW